MPGSRSAKKQHPTHVSVIKSRGNRAPFERAAAEKWLMTKVEELVTHPRISTSPMTESCDRKTLVQHA